MSRPFLKMNGLGNDFVVVEAREQPFRPTADDARRIADRGNGIGCDQLIGLEPSDRADAYMRIWNADGGEVDACGNATRCVGWLLMQASGKDAVVIETGAGLLQAARGPDGAISVDMGEPGLDWRQIPLAEDLDTRRIEVLAGPVGQTLQPPGAVSMGNPHIVFFLDHEPEEAMVRGLGSMLEHHPLFPEAVNVGFAHVEAPDRIRFRVWERGAGMTRACGTGACAALVAAARRGLSARRATVVMDGGELSVEWREADNHVIMTGPVEVEFTGRLPEAVAA
ncbi:MAG: diaminopimelate epimerase [Caulobacteraceae bacterium]|nr:MAG: diaminopimelate epimerase [Caulobacteraceae bacterium]